MKQDCRDQKNKSRWHGLVVLEYELIAARGIAFRKIGERQHPCDNCKAFAEDNLCLIKAWFGPWCGEQCQLPQTIVDLTT